MLDMPYTLFDAIQRGLLFLSFEELPQDEQPPRSIWLNQPRLAAWFREVKRKREREAKGEGGHDIEDEVRNPAARDLIRG